MADYPVEIKDTDFKDTSGQSLSGGAIILPVERSVLSLSSKNVSDLHECSIVELGIESTTTGKSCSKSFSKYETVPSSADQNERFHFVPLLENLKVHWKFTNQNYIKSAELELFRNVNGNAEKLWTKKIVWDVGKCPEAGETPFNGDFSDDVNLKQAKDAREITVTEHCALADFPHKCLSVEHSPYMLRLTITEATIQKRAFTRWLFLDVLVHSIELDWGADTLLPQDRPDITDDAKHVGYKAKVLGYEKNILNELKTNARPDTAGVVHKVILDSNLFAVAGKGQPNEEAAKNTDYKEYEALWGKGPRIPLLAKVYLRKSDDNSTKGDSGAAEQIKIAKALGNSRVLWDWADNAPQRWKEPLDAGATNKTEPFLDKAYNQHNQPSLPNNSCNCPADLGGKRGNDNAWVFPEQKEIAPFGFKVDPCTNRKWASHSSFGKDVGSNPTNTTGVIFQPARQAGDTYTVIAYMDFVQKPDGIADIQTVPALQSTPAKFKVFRRVKVNYMVRGTNAKLGCDPAQLQPAMEQLFLKEVDIILDVIRTPVNNNSYITALKNALDEVEQEDGPLRTFDNLPLLFRNLIDTNPPADAPAICLHPKNVFLTNLEQQFQNSRLRVMYERTDKPPKNNEVVGKTSGAKGQLLTTIRYNPAEPTGPGVRDLRYLVLLPGAGPDFSAHEDIESRTGSNNAKQTNTVTVDAVRSCWGHSVTTEEDTSNTHKEAISVVINGTTTLVKYDKPFASTKLKDELSNKEKEKLRTALRTAGQNQNESQPMVIKLRGRIHSVKAEAKRAKGVAEDQVDDNAAERMLKLKTFIEEQFQQFVVADRKAVHQRFITQAVANDVWKEIQADNIKQTCQKKVAEWLFVPIILNYIALTNPGAEGVLLMHVPGRTNVSLLPEFKDDEKYKDLRVTGGFYPDGTGKRSSGIVFLSTVPPEAAQQIPSKTIELTISHEMAHSLFLPHTTTSIAGGPFTTSAVPLVHIAGDGKDHKTDTNPFPGDNCIMNYDLDSSHFCGMCMIRLRGWKWEPLKGIQIPEQYEYHIDFALDDVDTLFDNPANPLGQMERLQALGLFNHPLKHPKAGDCLTYSLEHARQLGLFAGTNIVALKPLITQFLMDGGVLPPPGNFAKMRLPKNNILYSQGMLKILFPEDFPQYGTDDEKAEQKYSEKFMLGTDPYQVDKLYFKDNPTLGKIPLKVTVKKRIKNSGQPWPAAAVAPNVAVYFQLILIDPLPAYAANPNPPATPVAGGNSYYNQIIAPPLGATPDANLKAILAKGVAKTTDPDVKNAPAEAGGKRIGKTSNVFCGTRGEGFGNVSEANAKGHEFAARVMTDQTGTARICFNPSVVGGDAYKLRIYVGPPTQEKNGQPLGDDAKETGTMVRWRTVRISRYINMPPPTTDMELPAELHVRPSTACDHPIRAANTPQTGRICAQCLRKFGDMPQVDLKNDLTLEMAKAYNELILEPQALVPVAVSTLGQNLLNEIDDLLNTYPRLNSLYWVRMGEKVNYGLALDKFSFPLKKQGGAGDKIFSAILPYLRNNIAKDGNGKVCIKTNSPFISVAEPRIDGKKPQREDNILEEITGDGNFIDKGKIPGGVKAEIDYDTGLLVVEFDQPQPGKQYNALYFPTGFLDFGSLLYFPVKSPFLFNLRMPTDYNTGVVGSDLMPMDAHPDPAKGRKCPDYHFKYIDDRNFGAVKTLLMVALGRAVTRYAGTPSGPYCPGLIFVRALALDTYEGVWGEGVQEGKAVGNIIYVFGGDGAPPSPIVKQVLGSPPQCGLGSLILHETSHGLYMVHPGDKVERHDTNYTCVMSYDQNNGDYCGKCNASMRGMKIN